MSAMSSKTFFYTRVKIAVKDFPSDAQIKIPFLASKIIISNDTDPRLDFSFQAPHLHGELFCDDDPIVMDNLSVGKVWFKSESSSEARVWAWRT